MRPSRALVVLIATTALSPPAGAGAEAGASSASHPAHSDRLLPVVVTLRDQVPNGAHTGRPGDLIRALRHAAGRGEPAILDHLARPVRRLWLANAVALRARPAEIRRLARDPAVARIEYDRRVRLFTPAADAGPPRPPPLFGRGDWGLAAIGAPAVWRDYGLDGRGVRVGSIDTGVDAGHPDVAGKVVAWRDFVNDRPGPYDDQGHGTHTIGTMVGGAAGGAPIGVAPGARVVVAKALDRDGCGTLSTLLAAAQWITDPDGDPRTRDFPTVVNASWGAPAGSPGEALRRVIRRWRALGIVPVFAAGNRGPRWSVAAPAAYRETFAVGALGPDGGVAKFSSRGPAVVQAAGSRDAERASSPKPDIAAPGRGIVSSSPGGGWASLSGTSMAAPHVAGTIALLRQADPGIRVRTIEAILRRTARDIAPAGADRKSGAGGLDARAAVAAVLGARAARPEISLIAMPPGLTNRRVLAFAVESGDAPLGVWLDGARVRDAGSGPLVRVPVPRPGRHTVALAALDGRGAVLGRTRHVRLTIDRKAPRLRLVARSTGLLGIGYQARAADAVAGVAERSLWTRLSDSPKGRSAPAGRHVFTASGPYWVEARVADRAGNVRRVRRTLSWPAAPVARRIARNEALSTLAVPFRIARMHRRFNDHYPATDTLVGLLEANWEYTPFVAVAAPGARPPRGSIGVWSDGRGRVSLSFENAGRRYFMEDHEGRVSRGVLAPA